MSDSEGEEVYFDLTKDDGQEVLFKMLKDPAVQRVPVNPYDLELPLGRKRLLPYSPTKRNYVLKFDHRERYDVLKIIKKCAELNATRRPKQGEVAVNVVFEEVKMNIKDGDISIYELVPTTDLEGKNQKIEHALIGRFEVKQEDDLMGCLTIEQKIKHFKSQLQALCHLPKHFKVVGCIFLYDIHSTRKLKDGTIIKKFSDTSLKSLLTIKKRYEMRSKRFFQFNDLPIAPEGIAEVLYRVCENLANINGEIIPENEVLEARNLGKKRPKVETPAERLVLFLNDINGLGRQKALVISKDYSSVLDMGMKLSSREERERFYTRYTAERCEMKQGLGKSRALDIIRALGVEINDDDHETKITTTKRKNKTTDNDGSVSGGMNKKKKLE